MTTTDEVLSAIGVTAHEISKSIWPMLKLLLLMSGGHERSRLPPNLEVTADEYWNSCKLRDLSQQMQDHLEYGELVGCVDCVLGVDSVRGYGVRVLALQKVDVLLWGNVNVRGGQ